MKRALKLTFLIALFALLVTPCFASRLNFTQEPCYSMAEPFSVMPSTFEATVSFPSTLKSSERGGVIVGNYDGSNTCMNFEI